MKKYTLFFFILISLALSRPAYSQTPPSPFTGAIATHNNYNALYVLNSSEEKKIRGTLGNIKNALEDPRLKGKLQIELVVFGDGVAAFMKTSAFEQTLKDLQAKGVILAQCSNTVRERKIDKKDLFDFISYVPSGNGEIILRGAEGWVVVHP